MANQAEVTPRGSKRLKEIFRKARADHSQNGVRTFAEAVNKYWGIDGLYHRTKIWTIEKEEGAIMVKDLYFLAPFTPYTTQQLKAIAKDEDPEKCIPEMKDPTKLDIVLVVKAFLWEKKIGIEEMAKMCFIQKEKMERILGGEIQPNFNDVLKICSCREFERADGSRYGLDDFFTEEELLCVLG